MNLQYQSSLMKSSVLDCPGAYFAITNPKRLPDLLAVTFGSLLCMTQVPNTSGPADLNHSMPKELAIPQAFPFDPQV